MTTYASVAVTGFGLLIASPASSNLGAGLAAWTPVIAAASDAAVGSRSSLPSISVVHWSGAGLQSSSYFSDNLYGHIHLFPNVLALGNLLSVQTRTVEVWNARSDSQALSNITAQGADGVVYAGPPAPPTTFGPNESRFYQFSVSESGGAALAATFQWQFSAEQPQLTITATRIIAVAWEPDWSDPPKELLAWKTDVIRPTTGKSQRRALRAKPRRTVAFSYLLEDPQRGARFQNLIWGWQDKVFAVPVWMDQGWLTSPVGQGSTQIPIDTTCKDFAIDAAVLLWHDYLTWEVVETQSFTASLVTLKRPTQQPWASGTRVIPMRVGRLPASVPFTRHTDTISAVRVDWALDPSTGLGANRCQDPAYPMYQGYDVLTDATDWAEDVSESLTRDEDPIDLDLGPVEIVPLTNAPEFTRPFHWTIKGRTAITKFLGWLDDRAGRARPFWLPNYSQDLVQVEDMAGVTTLLRVQDVQYSLYLKQHPNRRDVAFIPWSGAPVFRRIINSAVDGVGTEALTLDAAFGQIRKTSDWKRISFLTFVCLEQDSVELTWLTDDLLQATVAVTEVLL
jgi:hypothetical protein